MEVLNHAGLDHLIHKINDSYNKLGSNIGIGLGRRVENTITITHSGLVSLRDNAKLKPGQQYRITDYVTTTGQENTQSTQNRFDIIVTAIDEKTLSEEALAAPPLLIKTICVTKDINSNAINTYTITYESGYIILNHIVSVAGFPSALYVKSSDEIKIGCQVWEDPYFTTSFGTISSGADLNFVNNKLNAWKIWYLLDNDTSRFAWAGASQPDINTYKLTIDGVTEDVVLRKGANTYRQWYYFEHTNGVVFTTSSMPDNNTKFYDEVDGSVEINVDLTYDSVLIGKGVIYRMIDEFGNDCPYDFKNIQFKRWKITSEDPALESYKSVLESDYVGIKQASISPNYMPTNLIIPDESQYQWFYTFNSSDGSDQSLLGDICYGNIIKPWFTDNNIFALNNIVIKNDNGIIYNKFDLDCFCMSIGNFSNTTPNQIFGNVFDQYCRANIFLSDNVFQNTISGNAVNNLFMGSTQLNTINAYFQTNIFNALYENTIGTQFKNNICHGDVYGNSIENYFQYNTINTKLGWCNIGPQTHHNTLTNVRQCMIEYGCQHNTINSAMNSTFKSMFQHNEVSNITACNFGNGFRYNVFKTSSDLLGDNRPYIQGCTFGNYIWYNNFYNTTEASSSNAIKNLNVQSYLQGVETVDSNGLNVTVYNQIEVPAGVDYEVKVAKNSSGVIKVYCEADLIA